MNVNDLMQHVAKVVDAWGSFRSSATTIEPVNAAVNSLLEVLLSEDRPVPPVDEVRSLFKATLPQQPFELELELPRMDPALVPLAVMRHIMRRKGVDFCPDDTPNWSRFMEKYGRVIISAIDREQPHND